ncbi:hypothetical protein [Pseudothermotoga thermarum]|uniref:Uncharacterized protein n=1 Tax=Pseudothermotoga thermarum DSM 5069 TaxID=688269 RepID=F7YTN2_9THEM|nr:hypothetical protein [Pseudothermotoga thermarum]AEH51254.1 hypothetical protein Theth_1182 [Pseudothermotoga thermarum DSM 5069]
MISKITETKLIYYYAILHFVAREDGIFLPFSYYADFFEIVRNIMKTDIFSISPIITKNKKEVQDGLWVFKDFRVYLVSPFIESVGRNFVDFHEILNAYHEGIELSQVVLRSAPVRKTGKLLSGVFANLDGRCIDYEQSPELFSECLRQYLLQIHKLKYGTIPDDVRFFIRLKGEIRKQKLLADRLEFFGDVQIFSSDELAKTFCEMFSLR